MIGFECHQGPNLQEEIIRRKMTELPTMLRNIRKLTTWLIQCGWLYKERYPVQEILQRVLQGLLQELKIQPLQLKRDTIILLSEEVNLDPEAIIERGIELKRKLKCLLLSSYEEYPNNRLLSQRLKRQRNELWYATLFFWLSCLIRTISNLTESNSAVQWQIQTLKLQIIQLLRKKNSLTSANTKMQKVLMELK